MNEVIVLRMTHIMLYWQQCLRFAGKQLSSEAISREASRLVTSLEERNTHNLGGEEHTNRLGGEEQNNNLGGEEHTQRFCRQTVARLAGGETAVPPHWSQLHSVYNVARACFASLPSDQHDTWEISVEHAFAETRPVWAKKTCLLLERDVPLDVSNNMLK